MTKVDDPLREDGKHIKQHNPALAFVGLCSAWVCLSQVCAPFWAPRPQRRNCTMRPT